MNIIKKNINKKINNLKFFIYKIKKIREINQGIKGVFKKPKINFYLGRIIFGTPYFTPWNFNSKILTIRKKRPQFLRCKHFKLFGYEISYGYPISWHLGTLGWKDKYGTPRYEWSPTFQIYFFKWQFCVFWNSPLKNKRGYYDDDKYYEQIVWFLYYSDRDIKKAKETWAWSDGETGESTWNDNFLINIIK